MKMSKLFDVETKTVEFKGKEYELKPLKGDVLKDILVIGFTFKEQEDSITKGEFSDELVERMQNIVYKTLVRSYPDKDRDKIKDFTETYYFSFVQHCIELNLGSN